MFLRSLKLLISVLVYCIDQFEMQFLKIFGYKISPRHIVLYYHAVKKEQRERFARQMDEILRLAKPFSAVDRYPDTTGNHHVAVTFDDGLASFLRYALPELRKRDMPFTMFVPTGYLGQSPGWIKKESGQNISERVMNEDELRELSTYGIASIGSHCVTHRNLATLSDEEARDEMVRSKADLERILGKEVKTLSFPHGSFQSTHVECAKQAGYVRVFSIKPAPAFEIEHEFVTGRTHCDPDDWLQELRLKCLGGYRWMRSASRIKNLLRKTFRRSV